MTIQRWPARIISGGQTGVDRGALDAAIQLGIPHGGSCPRGRRAEDGRIPDRYALTEIDSPSYGARTEQNVKGADGTLLVSEGPLRGGSALTQRLARQYGKPCLHIDFLLTSPAEAEALARGFLATHRVAVLNVAGPRESGVPGISARVCDFLLRVLQ